MNIAITIIEMLIAACFAYAKMRQPTGKQKKYLDLGMKAADTARRAFGVVGAMEDGVSDDEVAESQRLFDETAAQLDEKYKPS